MLLFGGLALRRPYPASTTVSTVNGAVVGPRPHPGCRARPGSRQRNPPRHHRRQPLLGRQGRGARANPRANSPRHGSSRWTRSWTPPCSCSRTAASTASTSRSTAGGCCARRWPLMHLLVRKQELEFVPGPPGHSGGLSRAVVVGAHTGSTHTGLMFVELADGYVDTHVHSFESSFYVLEGEPVVYLGEQAVRLEPGACGAIPVGLEHAWRAEGAARWIEMLSPRAPAARRVARHVLPRAPARDRAGRARRPRPEEPQPVPAPARRHGPRPAQAGRGRIAIRPCRRAWRRRRLPTAASP